MRRIDAKLMDAVERDDIPEATQALARGADPLAEDAWGQSPLSHAANEGLLDSLSLLLPHIKLDQPLKALGQLTLPVWAAQEGRADVLMLILHRRDLQRPCFAGWTPLMWASHNGHAHCVALLLPVSDKHAVDAQGRSALMLAAYSGKSNCVDLLVDDLSAAMIDNEGLTAAALAQRHGHADTAQRISALLDLPPAPGNPPAVRPVAAMVATSRRTCSHSLT